MLESMLSVLVTLGDADPVHEWTITPIADEGSRTAPSVGTLARVLDSDALQVGEHGWLVMRDAVPLIALCEVSGLHVGGWAGELPDDPLAAVANVLFSIHARINGEA